MFAVLTALPFVLGSSSCLAESSASSEQTIPRLVIEPSSSSLAGGTAKLAVDPLSREGAKFVGGYRIQVFPYFFKSETGQLFIKVSDTQLRQMLDGSETSFVGQAQKNGSEITHKIAAKASPKNNDSGALTFTVSTDSGPLVFNTSYRLVPR